MHETDEEVAGRVKRGDREAFGILIERYEEKLTRYARRFLFYDDTGTDLVQDVFIKAYVSINSFDTGKRFSPWIYRIAHNEFINELKRKKKSAVPFFNPDTIFPHPVAPETADKYARDEEAREMLDTALEKLEVKYREPLVLYFFEEMSYRDIADVLRIPISTVGVRISRGKEQLRSMSNHLL